jgi:hypothetical protein
MSLTSTVPLTADEEVTLRRVAYGQSEERTLRQDDLARLRSLRLIEAGKDGPQLTAAGKERFESLPKPARLGTSGHYEQLMQAIDRQMPIKRR